MKQFIKDAFMSFLSISLLIWIIVEIHLLKDTMRKNMNKQNIIWLADAGNCKDEN